MIPVRASRSLTVVLPLIAALWLGGVGYAASISVDEDCSLSEAIHAANNDAVFDRCTAGDGADTITLTGNVTLSGRLPAITTDMTIDGSGHTISGNDLSSIFAVDNAELTLKNMTLANGRTGARGGAIHVNFGALNLDNVTVQSSWAGDAGGGIYAIDSIVDLGGSHVKNNTAGRSGGAGVYFTSSTSLHTLNIDDFSTFSGNVASQDGGAIHVAGGIVTIEQSSFSNNSADEGGAIEIWNGSLSVENTTMSQNSAREGGAINAGADLDSTTSVVVVHLTMANNTATERGAAIALTGSQATLSIGNTIIAGQTAEGVAQCHPGVSEYSVIAWTNNAISDNSCPLLAPPAEEEDSSQDGTTSQDAAEDDEISILLAEEAEEAEEAEQEEDFAAQTAQDEEDEEDEALQEDDAALETPPDIQLGEPRVFRGVVYYPLQEGSPAIDAANQSLCEELRDPDVDTVDTTRPQGDGCDIGAFELPRQVVSPEPPPDPPAEPPAEPPPTAPPPPPPEEPRDCVYLVQPGNSLTTIAEALSTTVEELRLLNRLDGDLISIGQELEVPGCADEIDPSTPDFPYVCIQLASEISAKSAHRDVRCEFAQIGELDKHPLMNAGINLAIAVWGRVDEGVEVCFAGGGSLVFMDASQSPPAVTRLGLNDAGDLKCGIITSAGTVVHVLPLSEDASIPLTNCDVTTSNVLRLRDEAGGNGVKALVPFQATMRARARTAGWFFVEFMGADGWISAQFVQTEGDCQ